MDGADDGAAEAAFTRQSTAGGNNGSANLADSLQSAKAVAETGSSRSSGSNPAGAISTSLGGKLVTLPSIPVSCLKIPNVAELPEAEYKQDIDQRQQLIGADNKYLEHADADRTEPDLSNDPRMKVCGTLTAGKPYRPSASGLGQARRRQEE